MLPAWAALAIFGALLLCLIAVARYGEAGAGRLDSPVRRRLVYSLAICACCTSWSVWGSVGTASRRGLDFLPIYLGPVLLFAFFHPLVRRVVRLSKSQNVTSIVDFIAIRYGKSPALAVTVALIVSIGSIPFIALQLRAITQSLEIFLTGQLPGLTYPRSAVALSAGVAVFVMGVSVAIGKRRIAGPEQGLTTAVAAGAIVALVAFTTAGAFVCWGMFRGLGGLTERVTENARIATVIDATPTPSHWLAMIVFSGLAALVMPRAFYMSVVESPQEGDVRTAGWFVPLVLLASGLMVLPIAAAGLVVFPDTTFDRDFTILALPIHANASLVTAAVLIGICAAAVTTILATVAAVSVILANDIVTPVYLRVRRDQTLRGRTAPVVPVRRLAMAVVLASGWVCLASVTSKTLPSLAMVFLTAVVQVAPAAIGGLAWERGTARGAVGGCTAGILVWAYTLLVPAINAASSPLLTDGPLGLDALRPTDLFDLDVAPFDQALFWSLAVNVLAYVALSLSRPANANERLQASLYVRNKPMALSPTMRLRPVGVATGDLLATASFFVGGDLAEPQFESFHAAHGLAFDPTQDADAQLLRSTENLIAVAIGAAAARTAISRLLEQRATVESAARRIVDDVTLEVQNSHDILQHAIELARDGMAVFDRDLRLIAWNRAYRDMFQLPADMMRVGIPLDVLVRSNAERGVYGPGAIDDLVATRLEDLTRPTDSLRLHSALVDRVIEMHSVRLHNGGLFFTYTDATAQAKSEAELEAENVTLEQRVHERTEELQSLNFELARAKAEAEDANVSKTRFLAAASHDLLQPLNAARLYTTSLRERLRAGLTGDEANVLATHVDASLEAVEDILGALLEISHLDAGATKTEISSFALEGVFRQLEIEFSPPARARGLRLRITPSSAWVTSDRRLLSRLLQNLISNAIKYTNDGGVLVGVRHRGQSIRIDVHDTGLGIPEAKQAVIFREFERLPAAARVAPGVGLGLSIVERLGRVLNHEIGVQSQLGKGSTFSIQLPRADATPLVSSGGLAVGSSVRQRSLEGLAVAAIDNERHILNAMETLLQGWDCVVATGTALAEIEANLADRNIVPDVILADYHIDDINGLDAIAALRARYGDCPAVLVTADRSPSIRSLAQDVDVRVLNKPLKPAALRALLSQWRLVKLAAE